MKFDSACLTIQYVDDQGIKMQRVIVLKELKLSDSTPITDPTVALPEKHQVDVIARGYVFRQGPVDPGGHRPASAIDKKPKLISQSQKFRILNQKRTLEQFDQIEIE